jgi:ketosteroid isomerase-like protein
MSRVRRLLLLLTAAGSLAGPAGAAGDKPADPAPVIAAERAFAARAAAVGIAPSFLEYMADDAVAFTPDPVSAKAFYGARPAGKAPKDGGALLAWWPNFAGVARSGDLGFTTGPATVNGGAPDVFYFTVWKKQADGQWKWVLDAGIDANGAQAPKADVPPKLLPVAPAGAAGARDLRWDDSLNRAAADDAPGAYRKVMAPEARMQGLSHPPATIPADVETQLAARPKAIGFSRTGGGVSAAADLAWTYGDARWTGGRGHYVRVWQARPGGWRLVFDQIIDVPPPPAPPRT